MKQASDEARFIFCVSVLRRLSLLLHGEWIEANREGSWETSWEMGTGSWVKGNSSLESGGGKRDGRKQAHVATEHLKCAGVKDVVQKKKESEISHYYFISITC